MIEGKYGFREVLTKGNGIGNTLTSKSNGKSKGLAWGIRNGKLTSQVRQGNGKDRSEGNGWGNGEWMSRVILGDRQDNGKWGMDKLCRTGNGTERSQGNREANGGSRGQTEQKLNMLTTMQET